MPSQKSIDVLITGDLGKPVEFFYHLPGQTVVYVLIAFAVLCILLLKALLSLKRRRDGLKTEIYNLQGLKDGKLKEISDIESKIQKKRLSLSSEEEAAVAGEIGKITTRTAREEAALIRQWDKIEESMKTSLDAAVPDSRVDELRAEYKEIEEKINNSKKHYHKRLIDEATFREITGEYHKRLIEIETELKRLKK
ncbi:MAG: hypothetical protein V1921_03370 [Candidatus Altiarchaeota archaeon]